MKKRSPGREPMPLRCRSRHLSSGRWARSAATIPVRADREKNTSTVTANWLEPGRRGERAASKNGRKNMAVNLIPPRPEDMLPVRGVKLGVAEAGIRKAGRKDLLLMTLAEGTRVAGVFTQNRFCAAPVQVAKEHLASGRPPRALLVNTGNANAGTGKIGIARARASGEEAARLARCDPRQVLPCSTGVIMEPLPVERIVTGLPACIADLREDNWARAAEAIMTTDTVPKARSRRTQIGASDVTVTGVAKGAGMIRPDMATLLAFVATDAPVAQGALERLLADAAAHSFNRISVDGDTSTNDSFVLMATGASGGTMIDNPGHR